MIFYENKVEGFPFSPCSHYTTKKFPASACRKKKIACSTNVIKSLREKNILPTILLEKKILDDQKSPTPTLKS